ncbi:related to Resistance to glucose repression protein 1 [Zygosaccharomyces bailii ISA1307]|nr:related to Resistance to glucose repression protein 1 [Zygosaccharomyces bailii ISA1307]
MANNLAAYLSNQRDRSWPLETSSAPATPISSGSINEVDKSSDIMNEDDMGPSVSMAVHADSDADFRKSTFNLKRTRSMGLLDEYIDPTRKLLERHDLGSLPRSRNELMREDEERENPEHLEEQPGSHSEEESSEVSESDSSESSRDDEGGESSRSVSVSPPSADADSLLLPQDDNDLMREPKRHVDYLSHEWNESDISNSWKYIILKKKKRTSVDHVNAARLENASWRTWAKARNHLKTVSPEVVNWSKDSDVTWLYGPIVRGNDNEDNDVERGYGSDDENSKRMSAPRAKKKNSGMAPKPILKKRTVQEILKDNSLWKLSQARKHRNEIMHATSVMDANGSLYDSHDDYDDYDALAARVNAQYYGSAEKKHSNGAGSMAGVPNLSGSHHDAVPQGAEQELLSPVPQNASAKFGGALKTILTSSNDNGTGSKSSKPIRHIHFNDRVEQCVAITNQDSDSDFIDNESQNSEEDHTNSYGTGSIISGRTGSLVQSNEDNDSDTLSSDEGEADDEDNSGLFISPSIPRRADSIIHSPITDSSSTGSLKNSKLSIQPIIKLLPATTLNYGSDDEDSGNSDYNGYGSSVSHNVNTYRGYDYMYDYNSVYTGDTSNFLPVENCDVVDVPAGIDLHTAMAGDNASTYEFNHAALSDLGKDIRADEQAKNFQQNEHEHSFMDNDSDDSGFGSDEQFIEDTKYPSSDEEEDDLRLRRAASIGKTSGTSSFRDLTHGPPSDTQNTPSRTCSFISGKPLEPSLTPSAKSPQSNYASKSSNANEHINHNPNDTNNNDDNNSNIDNNSNNSANSGTIRSRSPRSLKRAASSSFIFNSDSEGDDDDDNDGNDDGGYSRLRKNNVIHENSEAKDNSPYLSFHSRSRTAPPQSSVILPATTTRSVTASGPQLSDLSKSIRIKNSLSSAEVGASDVAIRGSFSPINGSAKSAVSNKHIYDKNKPMSDLKDVDRNLQDYHIDENRSVGASEHRESSESVHKIMQNARHIANKYLHSWKKGEGNSHGTKLDNKDSGSD